MFGMGGDKCPFEFNMDPATFKVGDLVSYRIPDKFGDFPFMGKIVAVHDDSVEIDSDPNDPNGVLKATREGRPVVEASEIR